MRRGPGGSFSQPIHHRERPLKSESGAHGLPRERRSVYQTDRLAAPGYRFRRRASPFFAARSKIAGLIIKASREARAASPPPVGVDAREGRDGRGLQTKGCSR